MTLNPLEQVDKLQADPVDRTAAEKKIGDAAAASGNTSPEREGADQALKRALQPQDVGGKTQLEANVARGSEKNVIDQDFDSPQQRAKASTFEDHYRDCPGADRVANDAVCDNWSKRAGADHQMNTANELEKGGNRVKALEDPFHPQGSSAENRADIVVADDYVVECKTAWGDTISPSTIRSAFHQAATRLELNSEGKIYKGVVINVPDGKLTGESADIARRLEAVNPQIRVCETHQVNQTLGEMRAELSKRGPGR